MQPKNCFVAMFDIIGFKALRKKKGTAGLYQQFVRGILPMISHSAAGKGKQAVINGEKQYVPDFVGSVVQFRSISDSVIFWTAGDSFLEFFQIVHSSFMLVQSGFNGLKAPYRGAIGWGDLVDDKQRGIMIGSAIEDAYAGEARQAWAGAMLTQSCKELVESKGYIDQYRSAFFEASEHLSGEQKKRAVENARRLVLCDVPTQENPKDAAAKYGVERSYAIDWTINMYEGAAQQSFEPSDSLHASTIASNTISFEHWARKNNRG